MKSEKGITLTSLVLYIMLVLIVLGILSVITASFQSNLKEVNKEGTKNSEVDSFNMYFLQEVKKQGNKINTISGNEILFTTGNKFSFRENMIYLNDNIKIAENIENCAFSDSLENGKTVITVTIKARDAEERSIEYVLSNGEYASSYENESDYTENYYTELEYIESTGTQYIDTGVKCSQNMSCEIINNFTELVGTQLFGAYDPPRRTHYGIIDNEIYMPTAENNSTTEHIFTQNTDYHIYFLSSSVYKYDNNVVAIGNFQFSNSLNFYLFARNNKESTTNYCKSRMTEAKFWNQSTLIRNFIPVLDKDGIACLYDKVEGKYYYNQGTGDFIAGPEI